MRGDLWVVRGANVCVDTTIIANPLCRLEKNRDFTVRRKKRKREERCVRLRKKERERERERERESKLKKRNCTD